MEIIKNFKYNNNARHNPATVNQVLTPLPQPVTITVTEPAPAAALKGNNSGVLLSSVIELTDHSGVNYVLTPHTEFRDDQVFETIMKIDRGEQVQLKEGTIVKGKLEV